MQVLQLVPRRQTIQFLETVTHCVPRPCAAEVISQFRNKKRQHSESFEKEPYPSTSSVNQDILTTHSHMERLSQPVSSETEGDLAHTQQSITCASPSQVGEYVSAQSHFRAMDGKSRKFDPGKGVVNTPLCVTEHQKFLCGPNSTTQKSGNSPVLMAKVHAGKKYIAQNLLLVAQSSSVERWGALGLVLSFGGTSESALMSSGSLRNAPNTPESSGVSHGTGTRESVTSSFPAEVTVPSTCPLKNTTNTHGSSGELHGTITATHTAQRMSSALPVPFVSSGVELVSRTTYINRKKRNRETCWRQSKALKRGQREAKRKLVAQPEISHEAAEAIMRSQAPRTDEKFPGIVHVSHRLALLHGHENVFFCTQCGAVLRLLKSPCDGSGESRQKARRKLERGLMPNEHVVANAKRAF